MSPILALSAEELIQPDVVLLASNGAAGEARSTADLISDLCAFRARTTDTALKILR
jgi:hypothetical protein